MNVDWKAYDGSDHILSWLLLTTMSDTGIKKFGDFDSSNLDVVLSIDGVEVDFVKAMDELNYHLIDAVEKARLNGALEAKTY